MSHASRRYSTVGIVAAVGCFSVYVLIGVLLWFINWKVGLVNSLFDLFIVMLVVNKRRRPQ